MSDIELDQSRTYREYFGLVQEFNSANEKFVIMLNEAEQNRQIAVEHAIKEYLNPLISKLQVVLVITAAMMLGAGYFYFVGLDLLGNSELWGLGLVVVLGSFAGGAIGLVGTFWAFTKISRLNSDKRRAIEDVPKLPFLSLILDQKQTNLRKDS